MGSVTALGIQDSVLDLETQIAYHLQGNHYPPVPLSMVQPCIDAIDAYYDEDYDRFIAMPEGVFYKGMSHAPAHAIVDQHHLCLLYTSPSPRDRQKSRMPSSA